MTTPHEETLPLVNEPEDENSFSRSRQVEDMQTHITDGQALANFIAWRLLKFKRFLWFQIITNETYWEMADAPIKAQKPRDFYSPITPLKVPITSHYVPFKKLPIFTMIPLPGQNTPKNPPLPCLAFEPSQKKRTTPLKGGMALLIGIFSPPKSHFS